MDILKNLHHPYLPQVLDFIESPEGIYTVMDFIPGRSFRQLLDEGHRFTEKEVLKYAQQLCEALDYLHSQNPPIIHGDIKPGNIMVTPEGNICLIDFNISGVLEGGGAKAFGYTPGYSSPEQVEGFEAARMRMAAQAVVTQSTPRKPQNTYIPQTEDDKTMLIPREDGDRTALLSQEEESTMRLPRPEEGVASLSQDSDGTMLLFQARQIEQQRSIQPVPAVQALPSPQVHVIEGIVIDKRSDIFSLGATLYTLLTGKVLSVNASDVEPPTISDGFLVVLSKALDRNPARRYPDAGKMLKALLQVHKNNRRYRRLLRRQQLVSVLIVFLIVAGVFFVVEGRRTMAAEQEEAYYELVAQMEEGIQSAIEQDDFEELYETAIEMYPSNVEAYYEMAYYLFLTEDYETTIRYIEDVLDTPLEENDELWGDLYYLYGECFFRLDDYKNAVNGYRTSLSYQDENPAVYRDYAISLVYLDKIEEASEVLEEAVDVGMDQTDVYMVRGELARMTGDYQAALANFESVLERAEDEYLRQRAYVMGSRTYADIGTVDALLQDTEWIQSGLAKLTMNNRLLLYERLAQDYITLGEFTSENMYYISAIDVFQQIKEMGWDTYMTYNNAIILCQRMSDLEQAGEWALEMQDKFPTNYVTYVRLAYLEVEKQNQKSNSDRDYSAFDVYYQKAKECYEQQMSGNVTDAEMQLLDNTWQQVVDGGWLE